MAHKYLFVCYFILFFRNDCSITSIIQMVSLTNYYMSVFFDHMFFIWSQQSYIFMYFYTWFSQIILYKYIMIRKK